MKKILILLMAVLLVAFLVGGTTLAFADEVDETEPPADDETVEVPKELWDEILDLLDQLKNAEGDEVKDIVENTLGARIREYFGESWGNIVLAGVFVLVSVIFALINRKKSAALIAGVGTVYKTVKSTKDKLSKKDEGATLDEIIEASAEKAGKAALTSLSAEKMAKASLDMIKLLVMQSNAKDIVKAEAEKLYQGAVGEEV